MTQQAPAPASMVYWRFASEAPSGWRFGYVTVASSGLIRMGSYSGDRTGGTVVDPSEIEWKAYAG